MIWKLAPILIIGVLTGIFLYSWQSRQFWPDFMRSVPKVAPSAELRTTPKTSSWWTSAYQFPSQPLFTMPGAFTISAQGLGVSYPQVVTSKDHVVGSYDEWCFIAPEGVKGSRVVGYGDWNVRVELQGNNSSWQVDFVQGLPTTYIQNAGPRLEIACANTVQRAVDSGWIVQRPGWQGAVFIQADQATVSPRDVSKKGNSSVSTLPSSTGRYRVSFLPDDQESTIELFTKANWSPVSNTQVDWEAEKNQWQTNYFFLTESQQMEERLIALPPSIFHALSAKPPVIGTYQTQMGELSLVSLSRITTQLPIPKLPAQFTAVPEDRKPELQKSLDLDAKSFFLEPVPEGVYFRGTWVGAVATLAQLADSNGKPELRDQFLDKLEEVLEESLGKMTYEESQKMVVAKNTEFGNEKGNDHHFHYGYYIRAAAVLAQYRPEIIPQFSEKIGILIADIANSDRSSLQFPFLRTFSPWESHSWADGQGVFADGNNQESTSEALNAWYGIYLWGEASKQKETSELGSWLFSQELQGTRVYWFGHNNPFPSGYEHSAASLVWGGKRDFATWFSAHPLHIYGIQWLPITPASQYLRDLGKWDDQQAELRKNAPDLLNHEWTDLYIARLAYSNPQEAAQLVGSVRVAAGLKIRSLLLQTVYSQLNSSAF